MSKYPEVSIGIGVVIFNNNNQILLIKRKKGKKGWSIPGGYVKKNETIYGAIVRETKEETNIDIKIKGIIGLRQRFTDHEGHNLWVLALAKHTSGMVKPDLEEIATAEFFNVKEAKKIDLAESTKVLLGKFINNKLSLLTIERKISNNKYILFL